MPRPHERAMKKVFYKAPKGTRVRYKRNKKSLTKCSMCKKPLHGLSRANKPKKSKRDVSRKFGANLCHKCLKIKLREGIK
jgi:large subunit ribosomal protein L34e